MFNASSIDIRAVVIGASAGGIEALSSILPALSACAPFAVLIVVHLPKDRPSLLPSLFSERCALPVQEAVDGDPVMPGVIYFAPPDYHLLLDNGPRISLSIDELVNYSRPSIDVLFESAADIFGAQLLAILLSGGNDDGAKGLVYVKRCNGSAIVQQPETALVDQMPRAALARIVPDAVLTPAEIGHVLREMSQ
jgi:two-component system chemotaxis response regulator CheB